MIRRLLAFVGLAAIHLATPPSAGALHAGVGETLRPAPSSEAPSKGTLSRAVGVRDDLRSADAPGFVGVAPSDRGGEPRLHAGAAGPRAAAPSASNRRRLPPSRAPPA